MLALWMLCLGLSSIAYGDAQEPHRHGARQAWRQGGSHLGSRPGGSSPAPYR